MNISTVIVVAAFLVTLSLWVQKKKKTSPLPPPGPKPLPIIGNIFDLTPKQLWITTTKWSKQYGNVHLSPPSVRYWISSLGDVCYAHVFGQGLVFLCSPDAAFDLLDKRGSIYSDKPYLVMTDEL